MSMTRCRESNRRPLCGRRGQHGLTLIEVLVTVVILGVGLLGLAALQAVGLQQNNSAYVRTQATMISHEIIDHARSNRSRLSAGGDLPDRPFWDARVATLLPAGRIESAEFSDVGNGLLQLQLRIEWVDERVDPDAGDDAPTPEIIFETVTLI